MSSECDECSAELAERLLAGLKETHTELDQGIEPTVMFDEWRRRARKLAEDQQISFAQVEETFAKFEAWRAQPLRAWRVVVKDLGSIETGVVKARSQEEMLAAIECVSLPCAPIENVEIQEIPEATLATPLRSRRAESP